MNEKALDEEERRKERWSEWGLNDLERRRRDVMKLSRSGKGRERR